MKPNRDLCIMACVFCRDPLFQRWVKMQRDVVQLPCFGKGAPLGGEALAKEYILARCGVASRNDLDRHPVAAGLFHQHIREPFLAWKEAEWR